MDVHPFGGNSKDDGSGSSDCGMPGTGTNYARRVGIVEHIRGGTVTRVNYLLDLTGEEPAKLAKFKTRG